MIVSPRFFNGVEEPRATSCTRRELLPGVAFGSAFTSWCETRNLSIAGESQSGLKNPVKSGRRRPQLRRFLANKMAGGRRHYVQASRLKTVAAVS